MEVIHQYTKKRSDFGHYCIFEDVPAQVLDSIPSSNEYDSSYVKCNPCVTTLDTTPIMAEHSANTDRVQYRSQGMKHVEGGWPENVDASEPDQVDRYLKRANKDAKFKQTVLELGGLVEQVVKQNNTVDIYEDYFDGAAIGADGGAGAGSDSLDLSSDPPAAKGLAVFRDPAARFSASPRAATCISWHPEGNRIAVAYSVLRFQDESVMAGDVSPNSYLWDVAFPNHPAIELTPPSPLVSLRFNWKTPDVLVGGCYNGLVAVFDIRKPRSPAITTSTIDRSHHDPVYDVYWIQSKTNSQFVSVSTDGQQMWWDTRKLTEPTEVLQLNDGTGRVLGGCSLAYNVEAGPAKYLTGTEQGVVLSMNMRKKGGGKDANNSGVIQAMATDAAGGKHHGPIYSIERNPVHPTTYLTVGDWTARVWNEKNKGPIMMTPYCKTYLTAGCWAPLRPGVFFTCRADGVLDTWDIYHRQSAPTLAHKVSDLPLSSIAVYGSGNTTMAQLGPAANYVGRWVCVGDAGGNVSLLELSENLAVPQNNEKVAMGLAFDRESKREENLEKRAQLLARLARQANRGDNDKADEKAAQAAEELIRKVDADFAAAIQKAEADEAAKAAGKSVSGVPSMANVEADSATASGDADAAHDGKEDAKDDE